MTKTTSMARTGLLAVLLAMVGFSYALATSNSDVASDIPTAPRAVGTNPPLAFANPFVSGGTDRDLGDAVAGSALTRLVRAKGGIPPYAFSVTGTAVTQLSSALLQLFTDGVLTTVGTQTSPAIPAGPFRFAVTVKDSFGTAPHTVTETFRLTFVSTTQFRFAASAAPDATQYQPYSSALPVINGKPAYTFTATGLPTGLGISKDGTVYGIPTTAGTFTFVATATDSNGKLAAGRSGTGASQSFTITVGANKMLSSTFSFTTLTIKQGFGTGKDGVTAKGVANLGAEAVTSLAGKNVGFRVGSYTGPVAAFTVRGATASAATARGVLPVIKASVRKFGITSLTISKDTINAGTFTTGPVTLPVEITIGDAVVSSQSLSFAVKTGRNGSVTLTYKGLASDDVGGSGQLLKVTGSDDKAATGDSWKVAFLGRIPSALSPSSATSVDVAIGTNFVEAAVTLAPKGTKLSFKGGDKTSADVTAFTLDTNKGKGAYTTGLIPATQSGIPIAQTSTSTTPIFFANSLTFKANTTTIFGVSSSLLIAPKSKKWNSQ